MVDLAKNVQASPGLCQMCQQRPAKMRKRTLCTACYLNVWMSEKPMCSVQGCPFHAYAKGICRAHYAQRAAGRAFTIALKRGNVQEMDERQMLEFQRERMEYQLRLERDAYQCAVTVEARLAHRREVARLERMMKGGA